MFTAQLTQLKDALLVMPRVFSDDRGCFFESFQSHKFAELGIVTDFVQSNVSISKKGVLRGLHAQIRLPQAKLVRVAYGSVYDVIVDMRSGSPTFGQWQGFFLDSRDHHTLFIPRGFFHGFLALEDDTMFTYDCDDYYDHGGEISLDPLDETLGIDWQKVAHEYGISDFTLSEKDQLGKSFGEITTNNLFSYGLLSS